MNFSSETRQSKLSRLPAYLTVQMVRFFYKEKESVNAKVLKVRLQDHSFPRTHDPKNSNRRTRLFLFVLKDVKFPLMLDVYELCTAELQERMLPIRSKFKEMEDKKLEKQQQKVRVVAFHSFLLKITLTFLKFSPVTYHVHWLCLCFRWWRSLTKQRKWNMRLSPSLMVCWCI